MPIVVLEPEKDAWVDQANPAVNHETDTQLYVGFTATGPDREEWGLIQWDLTDLIADHAAYGITVVEARLKFWADDITGDRMIFGRRITAAWNVATVDWNTKPAEGGAATDIWGWRYGVTDDSAAMVDTYYLLENDAPWAGYYPYNLVKLVQGWIDGTYANHGITLKQYVVAVARWKIASMEGTKFYRPILEIEYALKDTLPATAGDECVRFAGQALTLLDRPIIPKPVFTLTAELADGDVDLSDDLVDVSDFYREIPFIREKLNLSDATFQIKNPDGRYSTEQRSSVFYCDRAIGRNLVFEMTVGDQTIPLYTGKIQEVNCYPEESMVAVRARPQIRPRFKYKLNTPRNVAGTIYAPVSLSAEWLRLRVPIPNDQSVGAPGTNWVENAADLIYWLLRNYIGFEDTELGLYKFVGAHTDLNAQGLLGSARWDNTDSWEALNNLLETSLCNIYQDREGRLCLHNWSPQDPDAEILANIEDSEWWYEEKYLANHFSLDWRYEQMRSFHDEFDLGGVTTFQDEESIGLHEKHTDDLQTDYVRTEDVATLISRLQVQSRADKIFRARVVGPLGWVQYDLGDPVRYVKERDGVDEKCVVIGQEFLFKERKWVLLLQKANWPAPRRDFINVLSWEAGGTNPSYNPNLASPVPSAITMTVLQDGETDFLLAWTFDESSNNVKADGFALFVNQGSGSGQAEPTLTSHTDPPIHVEGTDVLQARMRLPSNHYATFAVASYVNTSRGKLYSAFVGSAAAPDWIDARKTSVQITDAAIPTNDAVPTGINTAQEKDGSCNISLSYTYTQGANVASGLMLMYKMGAAAPIAAPTVSDFHKNVELPPSGGVCTVTGIPASKVITFGIAAYRDTLAGRSYGAVITSAAAPDWQDVQVSATIDIDGTVVIDGETATNVRDGAARARAGLIAGTGVVALDVPVDHVEANVPGLDAAGKLVLGQIGSGDLDDIPDDTYAKVLATEITAGVVTKVADAVAPTGGPIPKPLPIPAAQFIPESDTYSWLFGTAGSYIAPRIANTVLFVCCSVVLPVGVTITTVEARMYRDAAHDSAVTMFYRIDGDGATTLLATLTHDAGGGGWQTKESAGLAETTAGNVYTFECIMTGVDLGSDARLSRVIVNYTMPSFDKAI